MANSAITPGRKYVSLAEAANFIGVDVKTIRRAIASGQLTGYRYGRKAIRVEVAQVEGLLRPIRAGGAA